MKELRRKLPAWDGDEAWLLRILDQMDNLAPHYKHRVVAFKLFWGLSGNPPRSTIEVAEDSRVCRQTVYKYCERTLRRLKHPHWWGDESKHLRDP
jgi:hypothetical protein